MSDPQAETEPDPEPAPAPLTLSPAGSVQESTAFEPGTPQYDAAQRAMQRMLAIVDKGKAYMNSAEGQMALADAFESGVQMVLAYFLPGDEKKLEQTMDYFLNASPERLQEKLGIVAPRTPMWRSSRMRMPELGDLDGSGAGASVMQLPTFSSDDEDEDDELFEDVLPYEPDTPHAVSPPSSPRGGGEILGAGSALALQLGVEQIQPGYRDFDNLVRR